MSVELLLLAGVAIFVLVRLFSVLGQQKGAPPPEFRQKGPEGRPHPVLVHSDSDKTEVDEDESSGLQKIAQIDPDFTQREFLRGARAAYEMTVKAFAEGDRKMLETLLTPDVFADYDAAIKAREAAGEEPNELVRLKDASIEHGDMAGTVAEVSVHFEAELTNGDRISNTKELWTFERDTKSRDPNWRLADVSAA
jgi:predicted lipid-binding transport protein (Tim44 family)